MCLYSKQIEYSIFGKRLNFRDHTERKEKRATDSLTTICAQKTIQFWLPSIHEFCQTIIRHPNQQFFRSFVESLKTTIEYLVQQSINSCNLHQCIRKNLFDRNPSKWDKLELAKRERRIEEEKELQKGWLRLGKELSKDHLSLSPGFKVRERENRRENGLQKL